MTDVKDLITILNENISSLDSDDIPNDIANDLRALIKKIATLKAIDRSMVETLTDLFRDNSLMTKDSFVSIMTSLVNASAIVYFKSAQMCKVYNNNEIENIMEGQLRTVYKHLKDAYEVVPSNSKQKIIIMCDIAVQDKIDSIKIYITEFMNINKKLTTFSSNDIVCYNTGNMIHMLLTNYYVDNTAERDIFVKELVRFIQNTDKNTELSKKIMPYIEPNSDFVGAEMILMPTEKTQISGKYIQYLDGLIGNIKNCDHISRGSTVIFNVNMNITDNSTNINNSASTTNNISVEDEDPSESFIQYIVQNKPVWYTAGKFIDKDILYAEYENFSDSTMSKVKFHNIFNGKLFTISRREMIKGKRTLVVKLKKYDDL